MPPRTTIVVADSGNRRHLRACLDALRRDIDARAFEIAIASARDGITLPDACNRAIAGTRAPLIAIVDSRCRIGTRYGVQTLAMRAREDDAGAIDATSPRTGCVAMQRARLMHAGWLDPTYRDLDAALMDLRLRFRAYGWRNGALPDVDATVAPHGWRARRIAVVDARRVARRWGLESHATASGFAYASQGNLVEMPTAGS